METLVKKRRVIQNNINRIQTAINKNEVVPLTSFEISSYFEKLTSLNTDADKLEGEVSLLTTDIEQPINDQVFATINEKFMELKVILVALQKEAKDGPVNGLKSDIKLPRLELPKFSGNIQEWVSFQDLFVAAVHSNVSLSGAQKLQYLKASLVGQPAAIVSSFQTTDANYDEAWSMLTKRYQHTRELVFSSLNRLLNQPSMSLDYSLRKLLDTTCECTRTLAVLNQPTDQWNTILVCTMTSKLDVVTRRDWEIHLTDTGIPEYAQMEQFLESRARALSATKGSSESMSLLQKKPESRLKHTRPTASYHGSTSTSTCVLGDGGHPLFKCAKFLQLSVSDRIVATRRNSLCLNCLRPNHIASKCTSTGCKKCSQKHNTLLHLEDLKNVQSAKLTEQEQPVSTFIGNKTWGIQVLLSTAIVKIEDAFGNQIKCRTLLDSGSQSSFITEECSRRLGIKRSRINIPISGLSSTGVGTSKSRVRLKMTSCLKSDFISEVEALILPTITGMLPHSYCDKSQWTHIQNIILADPQFDEPGRIDLLLGADVFSELMLTHKPHEPKGSPIAQETVLGWILSGRIEPSKSSILSNVCQIHVLHNPCIDHNELSLQEALERFWKIEECSTNRSLTAEETACENHFQDTYARNETGRYVLRLPFRDNLQPLGETRKMAIRRWISVENRLQGDHDLRQQYSAFMKEYLLLNHMELLPQPDANNRGIYYIPHHAVVKASRDRTKFRVVFDASARSSTGESLNNQLLVGPKLQDNLIDTVLNFRIHAIAFTADVSKMYRQFLIHPDDQDFQRIVYRESPTEYIQEYRLKTVTYGTSSAPYMATRSLQQLAKDNQTNYPDASLVTQSDFYVDDLMSGVNQLQEAIKLQHQLSSLMENGGLELRK